MKWLYDFDAMLADEKIIAGSPQMVKEQVWRSIEDSGINYFIGVFAWGNIPHKNAMRSIRYFVEEVMPGGG